MYKVSGTTITLTRGDTFIATVEMHIGTKDGEEYIPNAGDNVRFALKRRYEDKEPLILKNIPLDTLELRLEPEDTKPLKFGDYVYDVELTTETGIVDTFIHEADFILAREVH